MENKAVFNQIISDYEQARPGYPNELFTDIAEYSMIKKEAKILEIGSGPGQATDYYVKNQYSITGLELGDKQVAYLSKKYAEYPHFQAVCSSFEDFKDEPETYDVIFSATAFHWIKPEIGYPKAYHLLKKNGVMAVFWHLASIIEPKTEMLNQIRNIYRKYAPELDTYITEEEAKNLHHLRISEIGTHRLFEKPVTKVYRWEDGYTTKRYLQLMNSYSDFHALSDAKRQAILDHAAEYIDSKGGKIEVPQEVRLYMAKK